MRSTSRNEYGLPGFRLVVGFLALLLFSMMLAAGCRDGSGVTAGDTTDGEIMTATEVRTGTEEKASTGPTIVSIRDEISRIRGLPVKRELDIAYISREQLGREMEAELAGGYPAEEAAAEEKVLKALNLIEEDQDLVEAVQQMLTEDVLGYYDNRTGELKVVSDTEEIDTLNEVTLAHEITHALQDQSFSLTRLLPEDGSGNDDRDLAVISLIEGDATVTDEEYAAVNLELGDAVSLLMESLGATAGLGTSYLDDSISFPYIEGSLFVSALMDAGGWEAVDAAYTDPPQSSEQILHPSKYREHEAPIEVSTPDLGAAMGGSWERTYGNVIGEFDAREILDVGLTPSAASAAAAGWGGGRAELYEDADGRRLLALVLVWDTEAEADEFTFAMAKNLETQAGSSFVFEEGHLPSVSAGDQAWVLAQRGRSAVVIYAPSPQLGEAAARLVLGLGSSR